jgi:predicted small secreted protein
MKKKLFLLLLIVALAAFVFTGCTPPAEGEGEGEGEIEGVVVEIDGAVEIGGRTYVSKGSHDITVTFPAPVSNANVIITDCTGDYRKGANGTDVVLFPNADKTVWTGSGDFNCKPCLSGDCKPTLTDCCASYVYVNAGECENDTCLQLPVIVDCDLPYACIKITSDDCVCEGCEVTFESTKTSPECAAGKECCGDDCSGLAAWAISIYNRNPFDKCCETPCWEPIWTASGTECPIEATTDCLDQVSGKDPEGKYYVIVSLADMVGNEVEYYATLEFDTACKVTVTEYCADWKYKDEPGCVCTSWTEKVDTPCYKDEGKNIFGIGFCSPHHNCCSEPN